jgi:hypothetical protein
VITVLCLAVVCAVIWLVDKGLGIRREVKILKAEDSHSDAKKIVDAKTSDELIDDFNKRYPPGGNGS